jgi:hypothetical protein
MLVIQVIQKHEHRTGGYSIFAFASANPPEADILSCGVEKLTPQYPRLLPFDF